MAPDHSRRQVLIETIRARVQGIRVTDGYATDAGESVFLNESPRFGKDDPDVGIAIVIGEDVPHRQGKAIFQVLPIEVQALAKADLAEPWVASEQVLADIQRAIEVDDEMLHGNDKRSLDVGLTRTLPREPGSDAVGVGITYELRYGRAWGQP